AVAVGERAVAAADLRAAAPDDERRVADAALEADLHVGQRGLRDGLARARRAARDAGVRRGGRRERQPGADPGDDEQTASHAATSLRRSSDEAPRRAAANAPSAAIRASAPSTTATIARVPEPPSS